MATSSTAATPGSLAGKAVLITGAARGIGEHLARLAAARGARVALAGLEPERLRALAAELGEGHCWHETDVTDQVAVEAATAAAIAALGGLDVVVANAGIAPMGTVASTPTEVLVRTVEVDLGGVIRTVSATLPHLVASRGYYLLVSSAAAFSAMPGMAAYGAAKAGVEQFANVLRLEVAHRGVGVGTAHPSWVATDLVADARADLLSFQDILARLPGPFGTVTPVEACAAALLAGIERRKRRIYVPRSLAVVQALRALMSSPLADRVATRAAGGSRGRGAQVDQLEAEVAALGRFFGRHSAELQPRAED